MKLAEIRQFMRDMFFEDLRNKGMALMLAVMIWWFAFNNTEDRQTLLQEATIACANAKTSVIIEAVVTESANKGAIGTPFNERVQLIIEGQKSTVSDVLDDRTSHRGSFLLTKSGEIDLRTPDNYTLPRGVSIVSADPERVRVVLDDLVTEEKPVRVPPIRGVPKAPFRYTREKQVLEPATVSIVGPKSYVRAINEVWTEPLSLDGVSGPRVEERLKLKEPTAKLVSLAPGAPTEVKIVLELEESSATRALAVPICFAAPDEYRVAVSDFKGAKILFRGPKDSLDELEHRNSVGELVAFVRVDLSTLGEDREHQLGIRDLILPAASLPEGVQVIDLEPQNLTYSIRLERSQ